MNPLRWMLPGALAVMLAACSKSPSPSSATQQALTDIAESEELILKLTPLLRKISAGLASLQLPDNDARALFAETVKINGEAGPDPDESETFSIPGVSRLTFAMSGDTELIERGTLALWPRALEGVTAFRQKKLFPIRGAFTDAEHAAFVCATGFEALAAMQSGRLRQLEGTLEITWTKSGSGWLASSWITKKLTATEAAKPFFTEALDTAIPDETTRWRARYCQHEQNLVDYFQKHTFDVRTNNPFYANYLDLDSTWQHSSISAADVDGDGWDDLYLTQRWGANMLLRNRGDGTFEDAAGKFGLDVKDFCNCSLFADFDNDGDQDAFIGRSLEPSLYLANEGGRFVDRTGFIQGGLPRLVSSMSAADYNNDGLLDIYLCLYGPTAKGKPVAQWASKLLSPQIAKEMLKREPASHRYLDLLGPPNLLLKNTGGKFAPAPEAAQVADWHNTNASGWSDYDQDGDQDLYVSNDFGPSSLYRNDGAAGFRNVTAELAGTAMQGLGMGVSWDDFDGDGRLDLYVSNMFSKAGRRITSQVSGLDPRTPWSAEGSLLFHNLGDRFEQVAGLEPPKLLVAKVGWAFGGQFGDFDNDTWPDIFSPSGFYTAPEAIAEEEDL